MLPGHIALAFLWEKNKNGRSLTLTKHKAWRQGINATRIRTGLFILNKSEIYSEIFTNINCICIWHPHHVSQEWLQTCWPWMLLCVYTAHKEGFLLTGIINRLRCYMYTIIGNDLGGNAVCMSNHCRNTNTHIRVKLLCAQTGFSAYFSDLNSHRMSLFSSVGCNNYRIQQIYLLKL